MLSINKLFEYATNNDIQAFEQNKEQLSREIEKEIIELKKQGKDINAQHPEIEGLTLLSCIILGPLDNNLLQYFGAEHIKDPSNLLVDAADKGNLKGLDWLLSQGVDINLKNKNGLTALHEAITNGNIETVKFLLEKGIDSRARDVNGNTAFSYLFFNIIDEEGNNISLTEETQCKVIELLIEYGCDINAQSPNGETALYKFTKAGNLNAVKILLENGAKIDIPDKYGNTPILCFDQPRFINGKKICTPEENQCKVIELLAKHGCDINAQDEFGETALHKFTRKGNLNAVKMLLENGAKMDIPDNYGSTPIFYVDHPTGLINGNTICTPEETQCKILELFIKYGYDVNAKDPNNGTILYKFMEEGNLNAIKILLDNGAQTDIVDNYGRTPIVWLSRKRFMNEREITMSDDKKLKIIELLADRDIAVKAYSLPFRDKDNKFKAILLSKCIGLDPEDSNALRFFTDGIGENDSYNNLNQPCNIQDIFAVRGYEKNKIMSGVRLHKFLYGLNHTYSQQIGDNPHAIKMYHITSNASRMLFELITQEVSAVRPPYSLEEDTSIIELYKYKINCEKLQGEDFSKFAELEGEDPVFYRLFDFAKKDQSGKSTLDKILLEINKKLPEIVVKEVQIPDLPELEILMKEIKKFKEAGDEDMVKKLTYQIWAHGIEKVFGNGSLVCQINSFATLEDINNFMTADFKKPKVPEVMNANEADALGGAAINHGLDEIQEG